MKRAFTLLPAVAVGMTLFVSSASAQRLPFPGAGNRFANPFRVRFERAWEAVLPPNAKLIEVGALEKAKSNTLLILTSGKDNADPHRKLLLTHWDGLRFATDSEVDLGAVPLDALLLAHFRGSAIAATPEKGKRTPFVPPQLVTGEGVYEWTGRGLKRLFAAPSDLKLAIIRDKFPAELLTGAGNRSTAYEVGDKDAHPFAGDPPADGGGYVRYGVGTQDYPGSDAVVMGAGIRYAQSYWDDDRKWMIGIVLGKPAGYTDLPNATVGDRLVVFVPKFISKDKSFWALLPEELEETWRGDALPGRILDVRVGDPKNEGRIGILVLTAENRDKERRLTFYRPIIPGIGGTR